MRSAIGDKLVRWDPRSTELWTQRLSSDRSDAFQFQTPEMRRISGVVIERATEIGGRAVALTGSTARGKRTEISDLDYHIVGERPRAEDLPSDVDLYAADADRLSRKGRAGDDFAQWTLRCGCILTDDGSSERQRWRLSKGACGRPATRISSGSPNFVDLPCASSESAIETPRKIRSGRRSQAQLAACCSSLLCFHFRERASRAAEKGRPRRLGAAA